MEFLGVMKHGYDAAAIPASRAAEYQQSLTDMFRTGDASSYVLFLLDVVQRADPVDE